MKTFPLLLILVFLLSANAQAVTVTFDPTPETQTLNSVFPLDIIGTRFAGKGGGGAEFAVDESILHVKLVMLDSGCVFIDKNKLSRPHHFSNIKYAR